MNKYFKQILPNGLTVITVPMPVDSVTVMVAIGAGSRYETQNINGLSHFLEHMAFKGSEKRPSAFAISSEIDGIGGEFNAFTGKDHTGFFIKARAEHMPLLIDVLSDMILHPLLKEEEIEREKGVIIEEINMYEDTPIRHIGDIYETLLYGATPLGRDTAGKPEIIRKIKKNDFVNYISKLYKPNNSVIVIAGGVDKSKNVLDLIEKGLADWKKAKVDTFIKQSDKQSSPHVKLQYKKTEQAHLALGVRAYPHKHPKRYALSVLTSILGGGMSSRLFTEVRERRGLAYYVRTDVSQYNDVGNLVVQSGVDMNRIDSAITVIKDQLFGFGKKYPVTNQELVKAKAYIKGTMTLEMEDSRSVAGFYATQEILRREILAPNEVFARIEKVTLKEVNEVANEIFVEHNLNLAIIGPFKEEKNFLKLLK